MHINGGIHMEEARGALGLPRPGEGKAGGQPTMPRDKVIVPSSAQERTETLSRAGEVPSGY
jgi:hypothetical protein